MGSGWPQGLLQPLDCLDLQEGLNFAVYCYGLPRVFSLPLADVSAVVAGTCVGWGFSLLDFLFKQSI